MGKHDKLNNYNYVQVYLELYGSFEGTLCKDVLKFVFQTFDFQFLCFGFCVLYPVLLKGAMETLKGSDKNGKIEYTCTYLHTYLPAYLRHCFRNVLGFVYQACDF